MEKLTRSGYFLAAVLLHLVIFLMIAARVIFTAPAPPPDDFAKSYVPSGAPPPPPPPPPPQSIAVQTQVVASPTAIVSNSPMPSFTIPLPTLTPTTPVPQVIKITQTAMRSPSNLASRLPGIMTTETKNWGRSQQNIQDTEGDVHKVIATFPVYLASYADGDWGCNVNLNGNQIVAGSLPNLVAKMNEWSKGNLKGAVVPTPLDIGSSDLMDKMPPFVFFTGHKDFVLTDTEIENLRAYLNNGGCIWGDNCLAGYGSRFDVAFRREMKRVVPDKDKQFQDVPITDDIYAKSFYYMTKTPEGMNYYAEPIQHLDLDGKLAIIYTPNDYSDLFTMRILPGDLTIAPQQPENGSPLFTNGQFQNYAETFFRNYELPSCLQAQKMGMDIIGFMLIRFDKELILTP